MTLDVVKDIGGYAGAIVTIIGLVVMIVKPIRTAIIKWIADVSGKVEIVKRIDSMTTLIEKSISQNEELQKDMHTQNEALKASLRNSILVIYYTQMSKGYMTPFDLNNLTELNECYKALGGNSFVHKCVEQLEKLPISNGGDT